MKHILALVGVMTVCTAFGVGVGHWLGSRQFDEGPLERDQALRAQLEELNKKLDRDPGAERAALANAHAVPVRQPCSAGLSNEGTRAELGLIVQGAVRRALDQHAEDEVLEAEALAQPTPENDAAFAEGEALVSAGLADAIWDDAESQAVHRVIERMTSDQAIELHARINVAINAGKLRVDTPGGPF